MGYFLKDYGKYIGIAFLISSAFLLVALFNYLKELISTNRFKKKVKKSILKDIRNLDFHEKALLREFYINNKQTLKMPLDNETVVSLVNKHIIYQASSTGFGYLHAVYFPYSITEIALENLALELIDLPQNPTEEEQRSIILQRPNWAKEKSRIENLFNSRM